ncbi:MAG: family 43 glycosylhydrolase [Bacteroidota bacterium]
MLGSSKKAVFWLLFTSVGMGQSSSFKTFMNPVIPGDHPDCTVTKMGKHFYTSGSSFNPTPVIYHSTDLVHWEAVAQPVSAAWVNYGDAPAGGCWGGQVVFYGDKYWYFFSRSNVMHFTTANDVKGPWSLPTAMNAPPGVPGLGYDNSIFIDDDGSWYLLVKNGQVNNWIVQLGGDGQPQGAVYDLTWINPAPTYPYSWAEGPVMWKFKGYYYYCFARNVAGGQRVFRSSVLTGDQNSWVDLGDFFNESDPLKPQALFQNPNHASAVVMLSDSTHWVVHPLWRNGNSNEWYGQGRQGLLNEVHYAVNLKPTADYPVNVPKEAPKLPSSGIPWMVPHSDFFGSTTLNPEWSFLGYTPSNSYSLSTRSGWLTLSPKSGKANTVIKNDGEHNYSLMTKVDCEAVGVTDQAGIWIFNGLQTRFVKLYTSVDSSANKTVAFSYGSTVYQANSPSTGTTVWLKLIRVNHVLTGFCSSNGHDWTQVGSGINVADMDGLQENYNSWTGNRQGLFVQGKSADFDCYIYRDAYTPIPGECPANQFGTAATFDRSGIWRLDNIHDGDWALYAGVEFGNAEYAKTPGSFQVYASSGYDGGVVEVWLDSLDTGTKIVECTVSSTGGFGTFAVFSASLIAPVSGNHDVYLKFKGTGTDLLFMLRWLKFIDDTNPETSVGESPSGNFPGRLELYQNYPNPFNPTTRIEYSVPHSSHVSLRVFNLLGEEVATLSEGMREPGTYTVTFDGINLASGVYLCRMKSDDVIETKKLVLLK